MDAKFEMHRGIDYSIHCSVYRSDALNLCPQAVLVAGETSSVMKADKEGTRPGKYLGSHCSVVNIGRAYAKLVDYLGADRIIVVAQVKETIEWLRAAIASDDECQRLTGRRSLRPLLQEKLSTTEVACARLLQEGGPDYDDADVNPATVIRCGLWKSL